MSTAPEGLTYQPDFVSEAEERELLAHLAEVDFRSFQMRGQQARRTVAHFGWDYGYESWAISPAAPIPAFLLPLRGRCADVLGVSADRLEEVLLTRYPPEAGIGWHRDAPMFGPSVVGVSLLAPARMRLRLQQAGQTVATHSIDLAPRSLYVLSGPARSHWQHTLSPVSTLRFSITFRTVRERARPSAPTVDT